MRPVLLAARGLTVPMALLLVGCALAAEPTDRTRSLLADLPAEVRARVLAAGEPPPLRSRPPREQLDAVFSASTPYRFEAGVLSAYTDSRWFSTKPPGGKGAPILELRRWPGDSALALYALPAEDDTSPAAPPPLPDADLSASPGNDPTRSVWRGTIRTEAGDRPAIWVVSRVPDSKLPLGALLLPGDAGLGVSAVEDLSEELLAALDRVQVRPEAWNRLPGPSPGTELTVPELGGTPGEKSEREAPWQVARGSSFTLGVPPGFRARRLDGNVPPPLTIPGGRLWIRGRSTDMDGDRISVGDEIRVGYVAEVPTVDEEWASGQRPPLGAPGAEMAASEPFRLAAERTGASSATAERWTEEGFEGDWLVFRLVFEDGGVEIGLPVLEGRRSMSLFWIPATWRSADRPPAPPPVDPAERFGIRFERLRGSEKSDQPWTEGYLTVPGLRLELPKGWYPAASLRSADGFPVRFVDGSGVSRGTLIRVDAADLPDVDGEATEWTALKHPGRHRAARVHSNADGDTLFVARDGHGYLLEAQAVREAQDRDRWKLLVESVQLIGKQSPR